ncbi:MAG TPA: SgcJ/EcaC family oxidoreductase [Steroidobacteraceae bacterium]|nr:SgcJ/EcaC family oxidoreductase [Steroidobacteraceae bacterium]
MQEQYYDETTIKDVVERMIEAWNHGDAIGFAAPFAEDADFIAFEGTHLRGRAEIVEFHQPLFDTVLKGTRLEGGVKFVRFVYPQVAVLHAWGTTTLGGQTNASPSRDSMQLFVFTKHERGWLCDAMLNARRITLAQQAFADDFATLSAGDQREVTHRVASMRH